MCNCQLFSAETGITLVMAWSQSLPPFGAAPFKHQPSALSAHPFTKPVRFGATPIIWLKGSLHKTKTPSVSCCLKTKRLTIAPSGCQGDSPDALVIAILRSVKASLRERWPRELRLPFNDEPRDRFKQGGVVRYLPDALDGLLAHLASPLLRSIKTIKRGVGSLLRRGVLACCLP